MLGWADAGIQEWRLAAAYRGAMFCPEVLKEIGTQGQVHGLFTSRPEKSVAHFAHAIQVPLKELRQPSTLSRSLDNLWGRAHGVSFLVLLWDARASVTLRLQMRKAAENPGQPGTREGAHCQVCLVDHVSTAGSYPSRQTQADRVQCLAA